ncbi:hypothetical protein BBP40_009150 [Aspergillus hancockii]|nr:hypothetical protein BBP40_009150 [Aspergillus hancockii]
MGINFAHSICGTAFQAPWAASDVTDEGLNTTLSYLNTTDFVAYDPKFFNIIGSNGPPGGDDGVHMWQYLLDMDTNTFAQNHHRSSDQSPDGGARDDQSTKPWEKSLLNNYLTQAFAGFHDLEMDPDGNFWLTGSKSGRGREIVDFAPPTNPSVYFVKRSTLRTKVLHSTAGKANGVAISPDRSTLYVPDTGVSEYFPVALGFTLGTISVGGGDNVAISLTFGDHELWIVGRGGVCHVQGIQEQLARDW